MSTMFNPGPSPYGASNGPIFRREGPSSPHVPADYYPTYYHPAGVHSFFKNDQPMYYPPSMEFSSGVFDPRQLPPFPHPDFIKYQSVVQRVPGIEAIQCRWNENGKECGLLFASSADITVHLVHHHIAAIDTTLHLCAWTNCARAHRAFKAKYKLVNHVRVHTGERPFVCNKCDKDFARAENLKIHMRTHTGEKPFKCTHPNCGRTFANSSDRKKHMHVHTTEKPYLCKVKGCEKTYTHPSSLRKHMKMHEKNGEYGPEMDESCDSGHASSTTPVDDFSPKQENEYIMPMFDVSPQTSLPQPQSMQPIIMEQHQAHLLQDHQQQEQQLHQLYPHNPMPLQPCQPQFTTLSNAPPGFSMAADLYKFPY